MPFERYTELLRVPIILLIQGDSGKMGDLMTYIRGMREVDGIGGSGEDMGAVMDTGGSREAVEGHVRRDFGSGKGAVATGIWQAW